MDILLGIFATGLIELVKLTTKHFGVEMGRLLIFGSLFVIVFVMTWFTNSGAISQDFWDNLVKTAAMATATFEWILKPLIKVLKLNSDEPTS